jgi:hypothetical protein
MGMIGQLPRGQPYKLHTPDADWTDVEDSQPQKPKKQSSQIAKELSDMVIYVQVRQSMNFLLSKINFIYSVDICCCVYKVLLSVMLHRNSIFQFIIGKSLSLQKSLQEVVTCC